MNLFMHSIISYNNRHNEVQLTVITLKLANKLLYYDKKKTKTNRKAFM